MNSIFLIYLNPDTNTVVDLKGVKTVTVKQKHYNERMSLVLCISAEGDKLPPLTL